MIAGCEPLPPLWPGSITMTSPASDPVDDALWGVEPCDVAVGAVFALGGLTAGRAVGVAVLVGVAVAVAEVEGVLSADRSAAAPDVLGRG